MKEKAARNFSKNPVELNEQPIDYTLAILQQHLSVKPA
jgi:hypothetical protein